MGKISHKRVDKRDRVYAKAMINCLQRSSYLEIINLAMMQTNQLNDKLVSIYTTIKEVVMVDPLEFFQSGLADVMALAEAQIGEGQVDPRLAASS